MIGCFRAAPNSGPTSKSLPGPQFSFGLDLIMVCYFKRIYVEFTRPKIESRDPIFFTGTRSRSRVSGNDQLFPHGSEFGPNPEIPASPVIQLRPRPDNMPHMTGLHTHTYTHFLLPCYLPPNHSWVCWALHCWGLWSEQLPPETKQEGSTPPVFTTKFTQWCTVENRWNMETGSPLCRRIVIAWLS